MGKRFKDLIGNIKNSHLSPAFFVMLCVAFLLWYMTKLSYVYTINIPVKLEYQGARFEVSCVVEGIGRRLLKYTMKRRYVLDVENKDLKLSAPDSLGYSSIDPVSLQSILSEQYSDVKVVSINDIPEILILTHQN